MRFARITHGEVAVLTAQVVRTGGSVPAKTFVYFIAILVGLWNLEILVGLIKIP